MAHGLSLALPYTRFRSGGISAISKAVAAFGGGLGAGGVQGGLWIPDPAYMFQDSAMTTPVVAVGDPVGAIVDLSGNGNHLLQSTATARPTYAGTAATMGADMITNGGFAADASWTKGTGWTIAGGVAVATTSAAGQVLSQDIPLVANKSYLITWTVVVTSGTVQVMTTVGGSSSLGVVRTASGTYTEIIRANTGNTTFAVRSATTFTGTVDNVSVQEILTWTAPYGLRFDGVDDWMATAGNADFSATNSVLLVAGLRKFSDAAIGLVLGLSNSSANNGSFELRAPGSVADTFGAVSRGTSIANALNAGHSAPITRVASGLLNIGTPLANCRVNSVSSSTGAAQGTGNYGTYPLYAGSRGALQFFRGVSYSLSVFGSTPSAAQLSMFEALAASRSGVVL